MKKLVSAILTGILIFCTGCSYDYVRQTETIANVSKDENDEIIVTTTTESEKPLELPTEPLGTGIGVNPGRVTWAYNPKSFTWDGSGYWWLEKNFDSSVVKQMMTDIICQLAGDNSIVDALDSLFKYHNERVNGKAESYITGEKIAIKLNMNATGTVSASNNDTQGYYPAPVSIRALLEILVDYGVAPEDITVFDASRMIPTYIQEMCSEGELKGVKFIYNDGTRKGKACPVADTSKPIQWSIDFTTEVNYSDYNGYPTYNTSYYPKCVTEAEYLINLFNLRGHSLAGITGAAKNHFGTIMPGYTDNNGEIRFPSAFLNNPPSYSGIHNFIAAHDYYAEPKELWTLPQRSMGSYSVLVDLISNADCGAKTVLYICDGLAATHNQSSKLTLNEKWCSAPFGDGTKNGSGWTTSLFASQDPIAIDSVALDFLLAEQAACEKIGDNSWNQVLPSNTTVENYLIEGALADNPLSGVVYQNGYGEPVGSLGVFQHWNNAEDKLYSRNLGEDEGIELIVIEY